MRVHTRGLKRPQLAGHGLLSPVPTTSRRCHRTRPRPCPCPKRQHRCHHRRRRACASWPPHSRLFDFDARMCALARLFFPDEKVVRQFDIRAESVGVLVADVESAVPDPDRQRLHINAGLPCKDGSKANPHRDPPELLEHVATFFFVVRRLQERFAKLAWFVENVVCEPFVATMKVLFPDSVPELIGSGWFTAERRKRAYFASPEFDLTKLTQHSSPCLTQRTPGKRSANPSRGTRRRCSAARCGHRTTARGTCVGRGRGRVLMHRAVDTAANIATASGRNTEGRYIKRFDVAPCVPPLVLEMAGSVYTAPTEFMRRSLSTHSDHDCYAFYITPPHD